MVLQVLFWILLILTAIAALVPDAAWPYLPRARWIIVLILIGILGLRVFGDPVYH
jgi:hypothetical protein